MHFWTATFAVVSHSTIHRNTMYGPVYIMHRILIFFFIVALKIKKQKLDRAHLEYGTFQMIHISRISDPKRNRQNRYEKTDCLQSCTMCKVQVQNIKWSHYQYDLSDGFGFGYHYTICHIAILFPFCPTERRHWRANLMNEWNAREFFSFFCTRAHDQFAIFITFNTINRHR